MNVLGFCCGRKNGNTEIMMKEAFMTIEEKTGATCNLVRIQDAYIHKCEGCESCMINHLKGNWDFRCIHKVGSDHFNYIEQLMREADAIIVSSPVYNLMPTGPLINFLNKMHASGNYRDVVHKENKIAAAFTLGGTDWTNYALSICKMTAMEFAGSYDAVVDAVHFDFLPSKDVVLLHDEVLERMRELGENISDALLAKQDGKTIEYRGKQGICPDCHGDLLQVMDDGFYCPQCLIKADVTGNGSDIKIEFKPEEVEKSRWRPWGQELHNNNIRKGHMEAAKGMADIKERQGKYTAYDRAVKLPELVKE